MRKTKKSDEEKERDQMLKETARNIASLADSVSALLNGPINKKALLILLAHSTKMNQYQVDHVLNALRDLKKDYLN